MKLKNEDHSVDALILHRRGNKIITGDIEREGPERKRVEGRKGGQDQVWEGTGEKYRGSGN